MMNLPFRSRTVGSFGQRTHLGFGGMVPIRYPESAEGRCGATGQNGFPRSRSEPFSKCDIVKPDGAQPERASYTANPCRGIGLPGSVRDPAPVQA